MQTRMTTVLVRQTILNILHIISTRPDLNWQVMNAVIGRNATKKVTVYKSGTDKILY